MAGGLISGLALVFAEFTKQQQVVKVKAETAIELINLSQRMSGELYNGKSCKNTIGTDVVLTPLGGPWPYPITSIKNINNESIVNVGEKYGNGLLKIHSMELELPKINGNVTESNFVVVFEKASRAIKGERKVSRKYSLSLESDSNGKLSGCNADVGGDAALMKNQLCTKLGGVWNASRKSCTDPNNASGKRAMLCPEGHFMVGLHSGLLHCMPIYSCEVRSKCVVTYRAKITEPFCNDTEYRNATRLLRNECRDQMRADSCSSRGGRESHLSIGGTRPTSSPLYREFDSGMNAVVTYYHLAHPTSWKADTPCQKHDFLGIYSSSYLRICCK